MMLYKMLSKLKTISSDEHMIIGLRKENKLRQEFRQVGVQVKTLGFNKNLLSIKKFFELRNILKDLEPDILHGWMYHSNMLANLTAPEGAEIIWSTHHSLDHLHKEKKLTRFLIKLGPYFEKGISKHIYCSNTSNMQHQEFGYSSKCSQVIPNGIDINEFYPDKEKGAKFRKKCEIEYGKIIFGQAARFHPLKNQELLITVFSELHKKHPDAYLLLAGTGVNPKNEKLKNLIGNLGIENNVLLIGECNDMPGLLNAIDFYCSSSLSEAFPMVLGEAMACGTPCIATDVGDSSFIIGDNGWVVDIQDNKSFVQGMAEMICLEDDEYDELGKAARDRIKQKFSLESIAKEYNNLYRDISMK